MLEMEPFVSFHKHGSCPFIPSHLLSNQVVCQTPCLQCLHVWQGMVTTPSPSSRDIYHSPFLFTHQQHRKTCMSIYIIIIYINHSHSLKQFLCFILLIILKWQIHDLHILVVLFSISKVLCSFNFFLLSWYIASNYDVLDDLTYGRYTLVLLLDFLFGNFSW